MMRVLWIGAAVVGLVSAGSAQAIEIINNSSADVVVCLHTHHADNVGANFELYDYYWQSEGWWTVKAGQTRNFPGGTSDSLCWMRLTFKSANGEVIQPAKPAAGPSTLMVHNKAFKFRRIGPDKNDTWWLTIDGKKVLAPGRAEHLTIKAADAVNNHGCWMANGFYGYKPDTQFTVTGGPSTPPVPPVPPVAGNVPDFNRAPSYGSATLKAGFEPDPLVKKLGAGGNVKTNLGGLQANVGQPPDFVLNYTAGEYALTFRAESMADTTLLIRLPNGKWIADDDTGGNLNPLIRLTSPPSGRYHIWVGTLGADTAPARLFITER